MFGYATNENKNLMPYPILLSHKLTKSLSDNRKNGNLKFLRPDGKSQVSIKYKDKVKSVYEEGCLSVPNQFAEVERPKNCRVEYLDYEGKKKILEAEGLLATCIQHEMDHLEGILFIDYLSKLKKSMIIKKLSKKKSTAAVL